MRRGGALVLLRAAVPVIALALAAAAAAAAWSAARLPDAASALRPAACGFAVRPALLRVDVGRRMASWAPR